MITYEQVKMAMTDPPPKDLIDLFNNLSQDLSRHPNCINDQNPFDKLHTKNTFCVSATSIQSRYIAFVLGKHITSTFPQEVIKLFFDIDPDYHLQFGRIKGYEIDGCICLVQRERHPYDLEEIYQQIYS
ncbi:MAG: hypothetical protein AAFP19_21795 [Bacteroidota bacterium]